MYQTKIRPDELSEFQPLDFAGVEMRTLHLDENTGAMTVMTRLAAGASIPAHSHTHADEIVYVLEGELLEDGVSYPFGIFFHGARGTEHGPHKSEKGCVLLTHFSATLDFVLAE